MKIVNAEEFKQIFDKGIVLVDFYADWCGPCKMLAPVLEEIQNDYPNITFIKINVDDNMEIASEYSIMSIPALFIFNDGKIIGSSLGYKDASGIKDFIDQSLSKM